MKYKNIILISISLLLIFISVSPVSAETYINPGLSWNGADIRCFYKNSGQLNAYNINQGVENYSREEFVNFNLTNPLRAVIFNLYSPVFEIDQPMLVFMISGLTVNNYVSNGRIPLCYAENGNGTDFRTQILDYKLDPHDNNHVFIYNLGNNGFMLFFPLDYFYIRPSGGSIPGEDFINLTILSPNTSTAILEQIAPSTLVAIQYMGAVDLNDVNYTSLLEAILDSSSNINTKLDIVINILNNQQTSNDATQVQNDTTTLHNQIDTIQNNNITDVQLGIGDVLVNPLFNLNNQGALSGAGYIANIATNIFNSMGTLSWLLVFSGFISIVAYIMGRVGILYR